MKTTLTILLIAFCVSVAGQIKEPFLHYSFDNTLIDSMLTGNDLTLYGHASFANFGVPIGSHNLMLDGANDYVKTPTLSLGDTVFFSLLIKSEVDITSTKYIISDSDSTDGSDNLAIYVSTDGSFRYAHGSNSAYGNVTWSHTSWNHFCVAAFWNGSFYRVRMWHNGDKVAMVDSSTAVIKADPIRLNFGVDRYINYDWNGDFDEFRIYKGLIPTEAQIDSIDDRLYIGSGGYVKQYNPISGRHVRLYKGGIEYKPKPMVEDYFTYFLAKAVKSTSVDATDDLYLSHNQTMYTWDGAASGDYVGIFDSWYCAVDSTSSTYSFSLIDDEGGAYAINSSTGLITRTATSISAGIDTLVVKVELGSQSQNYYAFVKVRAQSNCVFIDPTAASGGTGTFASPYNDWDNVTFAAGKSYLQKRGTDYSKDIYIDVNGTEGNEIIFGAYGSGNRPSISILSTASLPTLHSQVQPKGSHDRTEYDAIKINANYIVVDEYLFYNCKYAINVFAEAYGVEVTPDHIIVQNCEFYDNFGLNGQLYFNRYYDASTKTPAAIEADIRNYELYDLLVYNVNTVYEVRGHAIKISGSVSTLTNIETYECGTGVSLTWSAGYATCTGILAYTNGRYGSSDFEISGRNHVLQRSVIRSTLVKDAVLADDPGSINSIIRHNVISSTNLSYRGLIVLDGYSTSSYTSELEAPGNFIIEDNELYGATGSNLAAIRTYYDFHDVTIRRNTIHGNYNGIRFGRFDDGGYNLFIYNNYFYDNDGYSIVADTEVGHGDVDSVYVYNNTCMEGINLINATGPKLVKNNFYNSLSGSTEAATNIDIDTIIIADYFEDVNNGNPRLKGTATNAIDAGSSMTLFTDDLYGNERDPNIDIGACEYQP